MKGRGKFPFRWTSGIRCGTLVVMGDKPGHYWDLREARWVKFEPTVVELPEQAEPADDQVAAPQGADVRSG